MGWDRDGGNATYSDILPGSRQTTNPTLLTSDFQSEFPTLKRPFGISESKRQQQRHNTWLSLKSTRLSSFIKFIPHILLRVFHSSWFIILGHCCALLSGVSASVRCPMCQVRGRAVSCVTGLASDQWPPGSGSPPRRRMARQGPDNWPEQGAQIYSHDGNFWTHAVNGQGDALYHKRSAERKKYMIADSKVLMGFDKRNASIIIGCMYNVYV